MKFSFDLLQDFIRLRETPQKIAELISLHAFEVKNVLRSGKDTVFDIDVFPNRIADAGGHFGLARELSAIFRRPMRRLFEFHAPKRSDQKLNVRIGGTGCNFYAGKLAEGVRVSESPAYIKQRLVSAGIQPINNCVDIANYVMLETGQPLHVFDADKLEKGIIVRPAQTEEELMTIDGVRLFLDPDDLVIADREKAVALAGVKGGKETAVSKATKNIFIEAANFDPERIYRTSKRHNLVTDAAMRFRSRLHPQLAVVALERAAELLEEHAGGGLRSGMAFDGTLPKEKAMLLRLRRIQSLLGMTLGTPEIEALLKRLYFKIRKIKSDFMVIPPSFRTDLVNEEDVIEEIARIYGFNNISSKAPSALLVGATEDELEEFAEFTRDYCKNIGFIEVQNYSFVSRESASLYGKAGQARLVEIENPVSAQYRYLRPALFTGLCANVARNQNTTDKLRLFEIGRVMKYEAKGIDESSHIAALCASRDSDKNIFYELKGFLEMFVKGLGIAEVYYREEKGGATVLCGERELGSLRIVDAPTKKLFDIKLNAGVFELSLESLFEAQSEEREFEPLPKYPAVVRDIAFIARPETKIVDMLNVMENSGAKFVEDIDLFDSFILPDGSQESLAFHIVFRAKDRTLTDSEVNREFEKIKKAIIEQLEATIR